MEDLEMTCFQIISNVGTARSSYIEAIQKAKQGDFEGARESVSAGQKEFLKGHEAHFSLLQKEASGEKVEFALILMHAEDQMASTELAKVLARELIELY